MSWEDREEEPSPAGVEDDVIYQSWSCGRPECLALGHGHAYLAWSVTKLLPGAAPTKTLRTRDRAKVEAA